MKLRLTIEVDYDGDISEEEARRLLNAAAEHLADNGLLSGSSDGWVASATHRVSGARQDAYGFDRACERRSVGQAVLREAGAGYGQGCAGCG